MRKITPELQTHTERGVLALYRLKTKTSRMSNQFCITLKFFTDKCLISMKTFAIVSIIIGVLSILGAVISKNE